MDAKANDLFDVSGKVIAATGGGGMLVGTLARGLAERGTRLAVLDIDEAAAQAVVDDIAQAGGEAAAVPCDVLSRESVEAARDAVLDRFGRVDVLINGAGGNKAQATTTPDLGFFDLPDDAIRWVFDLNFVGTLIPTQIFGREMSRRGQGNILNISSMNAFRPLTRIPAYSAAKAAVSNLTQWLAVHMAQEHSPRIRVNALAPGFFETTQNRYLLRYESGELTDRGKKIIGHTPMARFGTPEELLGATVWLLSEASAFVTGIVVPIDGGFSAYSGV